jgi:hypothetical protein
MEADVRKKRELVVEAVESEQARHPEKAIRELARRMARWPKPGTEENRDSESFAPWEDRRREP